jgi:hypothetical protein
MTPPKIFQKVSPHNFWPCSCMVAGLPNRYKLFFICFNFQTLSLRNGKNTFSNLLKGKLLILENIQQLIMTAFTAGFPSVTTEDDVVSFTYVPCIPKIVTFLNRDTILISSHIFLFLRVRGCFI